MGQTARIRMGQRNGTKNACDQDNCPKLMLFIERFSFAMVTKLFDIYDFHLKHWSHHKLMLARAFVHQLGW